MATILRRSVTITQVKGAQAPQPWDLANETLYRLCREHPSHLDTQAILAKLNIIGRVYAAAIERRKIVTHGETNDRFYIRRVAPAVLKSKLDNWIDRARSTDPTCPSALPIMLEIHNYTMKLFSRVSRLNKRSLASKYLHFHVPNLFFICDSRARKAIGSLSLPTSRDEKTRVHNDPTYRAFAAKCTALTSHCESRFGIRLTPRELDNLLLSLE